MEGEAHYRATTIKAYLRRVQGRAHRSEFFAHGNAQGPAPALQRDEIAQRRRCGIKKGTDQRAVVRQDRIYSDCAQQMQARCCHQIRSHGWRTTPEPARILGVPEGVDIHLEGIGMREPADIDGAQLWYEPGSEP